MGRQRKEFSCKVIKMRHTHWSMFYRLVVTCLLFNFISPSHGFFFPKSFFRKSPSTEQSSSYHPPPQQHPRILGNGGHLQFGSDQLQGSGTDIQPAIRIVNRPPPPRNNDQQQGASGPPPGSQFHVPRELCLACEKFPWMPVAGVENPSVSGSASSFSHSQVQPQPYNNNQNSQFISQDSQPTKTIVINALGEAPGPVPFPPSIPSRRPFAIQFDANQSGNKVNYQEGPKSQHAPPPPPPPLDNPSQGHQNRPVSFQIYQAETPRPVTILQQSQVSQTIGLEPPPHLQEYGQPTILHPQNAPVKQPVGDKPNVQVQGNGIPPPNPLTVGTIIASQQNNVRLPEFQKIQPAKLVYQEHFTSPSGSSAQNFRVPIISNQPPNIQDNKQNNGYVQSNNIAPIQPAPQPNSGPHPQGIFLQMRPPAPFNIPHPRPSTNMKPPGPMIHYGKPVHIPNNVGPQRPSGQIMFPPPQAFFQMAPPPPPPRGNLVEQQPSILYGVNRPNSNGLFHEERRPSPSGQILNVQLPNNNVQSQPEGINNNFIQPVPIPVPTPAQHSAGPPNHAQNPNNGVQRRPDSQPATFTQETGWEIIPSIQTDLTHLFAPGKGPQNNQNQGNKELPVPAPIPVPQSNPPKPPLFIVTGANQQQDETQIKVQDVTYHEEARNPPNNEPSQSNLNDNNNKLGNNNQEEQRNQPQTNLNTLNEHQISNQMSNTQQQGNYGGSPPQPQPFRPRPFILGVPPMRPVMFAPHISQQFQPSLSPSIMTDLNHAQQTSLLTHQYLSQANGVQPLRENAIFVRPVVSAILNTQLHHQPQITQGPTSNNLLHEPVDQSRVQETAVNQGIDPRIPSNGPISEEYNHYNCQSSQQLELNENQNLQQGATGVNQVRQEPMELSESDEIKPGGSGRNNVDDAEVSLTPDSTAEQPTSQTFVEYASSSIHPSPASPGVRGSINIEDNGNKGSYFLYYPRPVSKSPVYWVQPTKSASQGVVRLAPQLNPTSPSMTGSIVTWSRPRVVVANQFRTDHRPVNNANNEESGQETNEEGSVGRLEPMESDQEATSEEEHIPYGQKLGVSRDKGEGRTPFDIITVSGSDEIPQSLEDTNEHSDNSQSPEELGKEQVNEPDYSSVNNNEPTGKYTSEVGDETGEYNQEHEGEPESDFPLQTAHQSNNLNNFESDDSDDEREDFGLRPQTTFRRPISTTVIHSPGVSSFQSMKLPNFKPHRVIVHDFTSHSANAAATGPSSSSLTDNSESQSEAVASSKPPSNIWEERGRIKAAKYVENDEDEDSSESINRPQGLNIQKIVAAGPITTADCVTTAHSGHSLASIPPTTSARVADLQGNSPSKAREIYLPLGSRFPGGRPSIFSSAVSGTLPSFSVTVSPTSTATPTTIVSGARDHEDVPIISNGNRERHFGQTLSGFAASIPVPVYRRPISITHDSQESQANYNNHGDIVTYIRPQANVLVAEDIYKESEVKVENAAGNGRTSNPSFILETSTSTSSSLETETTDSSDSVMSTEKSSSFSVSVADDKSSSRESLNSQDERTEPAEGNELKQGEGRLRKVKVVQVTSVPVVTDTEPTTTTFPSEGSTSTTSIPSPASTSTKIVKTVRVRQRMRSGSFNGPLRNRFQGAGRVRVVHRPATQEYIRHFPEFATQEGDKLAKEEEQEVKNALIELKKSPESIKTH